MYPSHLVFQFLARGSCLSEAHVLLWMERGHILTRQAQGRPVWQPPKLRDLNSHKAWSEIKSFET